MALPVAGIGSSAKWNVVAQDALEAPSDLQELAAGVEDELDASAFKTPPQSPSKKKQNKFETPSPIKKFEHAAAKTTPDRSFFAKEKDEFEDCLDALFDLSDTPEKRRQASYTKRVIDTVAGKALSKLSIREMGIPETDGKSDEDDVPARRCVGLDDIGSFDGTWVQESMQQLHLAYRKCQHTLDLPMIAVVNLKHILHAELSGKKPVGLHFLCKENAHLAADITELALSPITEVWCARYTDKASASSKISSFFPKDILTVDELLYLLQNSEDIARKDNRLLLKVPGKKFLIEMYLRSEVIIWSVFPIFYHASYGPDLTYRITDAIQLSSADLLALRAKGKVMYEDGSQQIVDIASVLPGSPVPSGIYIFYPKVQSLLS